VKILFISNTGESLPIVLRLKRAGVSAEVYIHQPDYRGNYAGIIRPVPFSRLKKAVLAAEMVVFDMSHINERKKHDYLLMKIFGVSGRCVFGPIADKLRNDMIVVGSSRFTEDIEFDRAKGSQVAEKIGLAIPETEEFESLHAGVKFLKGRNDQWVLKPNDNRDLDLTYVEKFAGELLAKMTGEYAARLGDSVKFILQKKVAGTEVSSEVWINKQGPVSFNHTIESKRLMDADLGPAIGSQSNTVIVRSGENKVLLRQQLGRMATLLKSEGYIGPCDVNCIIGDKPYFLEWTPRFGYDAIYCLLAMTNVKDFFTKQFDVEYSGTCAASERITIPPFPYCPPALLKRYARDVTITGGLRKDFWAQDVYMDGETLKCAGADGILGVVTGSGKTPDEAWGKVRHNINKLGICSYVQHRTDGLKVAQKRLSELKVA